MRLRLVCIVLICLTASIDADAARRPNRSSTTPAKAYYSGEVDSSAASLPHRFEGNDPYAIYNQLAKRYPPKSEYEPTATFRSRLCIVPDSILYAFSLPINTSTLAETGCSWQYDADNQALIVSWQETKVDAPFELVDALVSKEPVGHESLDAMFERTRQESAFRDSLQYLPFLPIQRRNQSKRSYVGTNAFGATANIAEFFADGFGIIPTNLLPRSFEDDLSLSMGPEEAQRLKAHADRVLFLCTLKSISGLPAAFESIFGAKATMDSPTGVYYREHAMTVEVHSLWFYDFESGKVLLRHSVAPTQW